MLSLIKSHKRSSSLDSSPKKPAFRERKGSADGCSPGHQMASPQGFSDYEITRSSPSFESLHKLTNKNKFFGARLFKKTGDMPHPQATPWTAPNTPVNGGFKHFSSPEGYSVSSFERGSHRSRAGRDMDERPTTVKGTRTHEWGVNCEEQTPVILLNRTSFSSEHHSDGVGASGSVRQNAQRASISSVTSSTVDSEFQSDTNSQQISASRSQLDVSRDSSDARLKHPYHLLNSSTVKNRNRLARIHSNEDILTLSKESEVPYQVFQSKFDPLGRIEASPVSSASRSTHEGESSIQNKDLGLGISTSRQNLSAFGRDESYSNPSKTEFSLKDRSFEEGDEAFLGNGKKSEEKGQTSSESSDDNYLSDSSSKFSFELGGFGGRTSSVKYYSELKPKNIYIDDVYEDDDFDEDMNYIDDQDLLSMEGDIPEGKYGFDELDSDSGDNEANTGYSDMVNLTDEGEDIRSSSNSIDRGGESSFSQEGDDISAKNSTSSLDDIGRVEIAPQLSIQPQNSTKCINHIPALSQNAGRIKKLGGYGDIFDLTDGDDNVDEQQSYDGDLKGDDESVEYNGGNSNCEFTSSGRPDMRASKSFPGQTELSATGNKIKELCGNSSPSTLRTPENSYLQSPINFSPSRTPLRGEGSSSRPFSRWGSLKYHDLDSNLDSDVPGVTSTLYYIDESEEDNFKSKAHIDDNYLDEVNYVPEDFTFPDDDDTVFSTAKSPDAILRMGAYRRTHSFSERPSPAAKERKPYQNKLELKNKTVTFFNSQLSRSVSDSAALLKSPERIYHVREEFDAAGDTNTLLGDVTNNPVTPSNSFSRPSPGFHQSVSLSPIQEGASSVDGSPRLKGP
ncbi:LAMI_0D02762g1_1 [Lachancea mirantina]|uniref:LAMI_0D02762g1_1 n=1 Tax=Lachancea mirantina TaxID=1230905 RepID=A0A1G4J9D7_9SACH|nr:LAMI_0D02762g1_1 [Lachancea mirantina]